ncbi:MAG: hypothetical protein L7U87_06260 [Chlamydiales bacterium]|nr:hypothetical protein [Chlamydiales bacterium]
MQYQLIIAILLFWTHTLSSSVDPSRPLLRENIGDMKGALKDLDVQLKAKTSAELVSKKISLLCRLNMFSQAHRLWQENKDTFSIGDRNYRKALEELCWLKLKQGFSTGSLETRRVCLIAAALQNDARSIPFITQSLDTNNAWMRFLATQLSGNYLDEKLWSHIEGKFFETRSYAWLRQVVSIVSRVPLRDWESNLSSFLKKEDVPHDLFVMAASALVTLKEKPEDYDIETLLEGKPAVEKALFKGQAIAKLSHTPSKQELLNLISNASDEVVIVTCRSLMLRPSISLDHEIVGRLKELQSRKSTVKLAASALLLVKEEDQQSEDYIVECLSSVDVETALLACAYVKTCGPVLMKRLIRELPLVSNLYVKANLLYSLFLLGKDVASDQSYLSKETETVIQQSAFSPASHYYPLIDVEVFAPYGFKDSSMYADKTGVEQLILLKIIEAWASRDPERARRSLEMLLANLSLQSMQVAMEFSVTEQLYNTESLLYELLDHSDDRVSLEAAILLAQLKKEKKVISNLQEKYQKASYKKKFRILEALLAIAEQESWSFLEDCLNEPYGQLSYIAAASLLKSLSR